MKKIHRVTHTHSSSAARTGVLSLDHGDVATPAFMPVGTNGTVKGIYHEHVEEIGYNLILANTYHLYLRPGVEVLKHWGGLHNFSHWNHNILTDSGGFQVFSLSGLRKIREEGVIFQSHIDGSRHALSPEKVVDIQNVIGSDIMMVLDVCTPPEIPHREAKIAWETTRKWAQRSFNHWQEQGGERNLFGIVQGNFYQDLRKESALAIAEIGFPGIAIGGLSVGETSEQFADYLAYTTQFLPEDRPRYVMGIGTPDYILEAVANGIDVFDCVLATRAGRNGSVFTDDGMIQLKRAKFEFDEGPIQEGCTCRACNHYSRGYLRHVFKAKEMIGGMLATEHNLAYLHSFMEKIRAAILEDRFPEFKKTYLDRYYAGK